MNACILGKTAEARVAQDMKDGADGAYQLDADVSDQRDSGDRVAE